jgi:gamma-glutamyltranspeptidase/glutathione hydrolase
MIEGYEVLSSRGAVAAGPPQAARVGARILQDGGNAMDAAVATSLACCMLAPQATGVGGYLACAVVLEGESGKIWSLDANSVAPAAAREDMYQILPVQPGAGPINENEYDCSVRDNANVYGPLAVGVPGQMAGMGTLWEKWGRLQWPAIVAPSQQLLANGFPYGEGLATALEQQEGVIRSFEHTARHFMPAGKMPGPKDIWHRPDMEKTLERLSKAGWRDFYEGELGHQIADYIQGAGGILSREDMANFYVRLDEPYVASYRDAKIYGPVLPNGCLSALQILQMLECFEPISDGEVFYWHRLAEVLKLAWRDRLLYLGDPDFVEVPIQRLLSKEYAAGRVESLRQFPQHVDRLSQGSSSKAMPETLHVSTADAEGNVVSVTITQGGGFGSFEVVPETGILLGHGMCRLDPRPGRFNSVAPGKRPLNNTATMILRLPDRDVALGMPGGRRIISVAPRMAHLMVDQGASAHQVATAPRMHVTTEEPIEVLEGMDPEIVKGLEEMGHAVEVIGRVGGGAHGAEYFKTARRVRAGGNTWAAGAE